MDPAKVANFDSVRVYRWLLEAARPDELLWRYLRSHGVDLARTFDLVHGAIARVAYNFDCCYGIGEDAIALPVLEPDDETPLDVVVFSMADPAKFTCLLELGGVLGAHSVMNPEYGRTNMVRTPLDWFKAGGKGHAVVLDPCHAWSLFQQAPGFLVVEDVAHGRELIEEGAVMREQLMVPARKVA